MADSAEEHAARFNAAVRSGDWAAFADGFAVDARMDFVNVPAGPFVGRTAIATAYRDNPPDDTIEVRSVSSDDLGDVIEFEWTRGGAGAMALTWTPGGLVSRLVVEFR
ncbi:MAG TPA: nuclear transport factor 2 family protein [Jatrophihabitans sp.]